MKLSSRTTTPFLVLLFAFGAAVGCGDSGSDSDAGTGGKSTGGKGSGGKSGSGGMGGDAQGDGGASSGGKGSGGKASGGKTGDGGGKASGGKTGDGGGENTGGKASTGGKGAGGGDSGGGSGGTGGGTAEECGNGAVSDLEQCDDSGTAAGDGCSASCTLEACDDCRDAQCASLAQFLSCDGAPEALLADCLDVLSCVRESGCGLSDSTSCYCGDSPTDECFTPFAADEAPANGPCKDVIIAAIGSDVPIQIAQLYFDPDTAVGYVMQTVRCEKYFCGQACEYDGYGTGGGGGSGDGGASSGGASSGGTSGGGSGSGGEATGGTAGTGGEGTGGEGTGGMGGADAGGCDIDCPECGACTSAQCAPEFSAAWSFSGVCLGDPACQTYRDCVDQSGCAEGTSDPEAELVACYCGEVPESTCFTATDPNVPTGLCKSYAEGLANTTDPAAIAAQFFTGSGRLATLNQLFMCEKLECESECSSYFGTP